MEEFEDTRWIPPVPETSQEKIFANERALDEVPILEDDDEDEQEDSAEVTDPSEQLEDMLNEEGGMLRRKVARAFLTGDEKYLDRDDAPSFGIEEVEQLITKHPDFSSWNKSMMNFLRKAEGLYDPGLQKKYADELQRLRAQVFK